MQYIKKRKLYSPVYEVKVFVDEFPQTLKLEEMCEAVRIYSWIAIPNTNINSYQLSFVQFD